MQNLSPEERERMMERMRGRGGDPSNAAAGRGRSRGPAPAEDAASLSARNPGATTIDALFGPLPTVETRGQAWMHAGKELKPVRLRLGITDGQTTEVLEGDVEPGTELVTNITIGSESTRPQPGGFGVPPFMGGRGGDFRGGNRGGGGGRGRG
jgi:hypothetical protein